MALRRIHLVSLCCLLILFATPAAQDHALPIVQVIDGQISIGEFGDRAHGYCQPPETVLAGQEISPDGLSLIIVTRPRMVTEAIDEYGPFGSAEYPRNLWLCDLRLGLLKSLAMQPADASFAVPDVPDNFVTRSNPQFSPDGASIAWLETRFDDEHPFLMIYDLATEGLVEYHTDLMPPCCVPHSWPMLWHNSGIWLHGTVAGTSFEDQHAVLLHLNEAGEVLEELVLEQEPLDLFVAQDGEVDRLVLYEGSVPLSFKLLDPATGEIFGITPGTQGYLELYNPLYPNRASLVAVPTSEGVSWLVRDAWQSQVGGDGIPLVYQTRSLGDAQQFAPGPDGYLMLWQGRVIVWKDGAYLQSAPTTDAPRNSRAALFWGPRAWRLWRPRDPVTLTATPPDAITCEGFVPSRLKILDYGFVLTRTANNLRAAPALSGAVVGQIPAGAEFYVWQGPVCADGYAWWQVEYDDLRGWTAEGQGKEYWLAPLP